MKCCNITDQGVKALRQRGVNVEIGIYDEVYDEVET
jgi:hypothetical protein